MGSITVNHRKQNRFIEQPRQEINKENAEQEKQLAEDVQNLSKKVCSSILPLLLETVQCAYCVALLSDHGPDLHFFCLGKVLGKTIRRSK